MKSPEFDSYVSSMLAWLNGAIADKLPPKEILSILASAISTTIEHSSMTKGHREQYIVALGVQLLKESEAKDLH
ncbi:MAG: hypothetical protein ACR2RE_24160 [Geminicoccaceae bacterium]